MSKSNTILLTKFDFIYFLMLLPVIVKDYRIIVTSAVLERIQYQTVGCVVAKRNAPSSEISPIFDFIHFS